MLDLATLRKPFMDRASSAEHQPPGFSESASGSPTNIRYLIVAIVTLLAVLMYLERLCLGVAQTEIVRALSLSETQMSWVQSAFFWAYALAMVPAGFLSDRLGPRLTLSLFVAVWTLFTGMIALADGVAILIIARLGVGIGQAGAYPASGSLLKDWVPSSQRALASAVVASGGRMGAVLASGLTGFIIAKSDWRMPFVIYCWVGLGLAVVFWLIFRSTPESHPLVNKEEKELIRGPGLFPSEQSGSSQTAPREPFPLVPILTNISLWANSALQFLTNVGWLFLALYTPKYFGSVHGVDLETRGYMASIPPFVGIVGMLAGGGLTDWLMPRIGLQWSRRAPLVITRFTAAIGYGLAIGLSLLVPPGTGPAWMPWVYVIPFSLVYASTDFANPAIWAYAQDVGGKFVASVMAWANMWGNIGAALAPLLYNSILGEAPVLANWNMMFGICALAYILAGCFSLLLDCTRKLA